MFGKKREDAAMGAENTARPETPRPERREEAVDSAKRSLTTVAGVSIAVAALAVGLSGWRVIEATNLQNRLEGDLTEVVTPTREIASGEVISEADLTVAGVPSAFAPADAATEIDQVAGRVSLTTQGEGMAVPLSSIRASESPASLPAALSEGHVGLMLTLDAADAVSPLLTVGDRVDVLGVTSDGVVATTDIMVTGARIVALDGAITDGGELRGYANVTLELTSEQARAVAATSSVKLLATPELAQDTATEGGVE